MRLACNAANSLSKIETETSKPFAAFYLLARRFSSHNGLKEDEGRLLRQGAVIPGKVLGQRWARRFSSHNGLKEDEGRLLSDKEL